LPLLSVIHATRLIHRDNPALVCNMDGRLGSQLVQGIFEAVPALDEVIRILDGDNAHIPLSAQPSGHRRPGQIPDFAVVRSDKGQTRARRRIIVEADYRNAGSNGRIDG